MTCRITVSDGVAPDAIMEDLPDMSFGYNTLASGQTINRFRKEAYLIAAEDKVPAGLRALDYSRLLTITVESGLGISVYTGYSLGPSEEWDFGGGRINWSLTVEAN